ncbi:hypothetical protein [Scytonema sp. NUACC26]|uniref:hypothetical protein n=1 Tax=Scytonema sp. NUACC26 TaxID=3140176 RepID=UPI0034DC44FB
MTKSFWLFGSRLTIFAERTTFLLALVASIATNFSLPAAADSTVSLILSLRCRGGYNINIWKTNTSGELLYRSTSPHGNLSLGRGTRQATEGTQVYRFQNGNYQYWVWDGTLDSKESGTLEVYKNNQIELQRACKKH